MSAPEAREIFSIMMQTMRNPKVLKWGLWTIIILVIPSFVAFYGFSQAGSSGRGGGADTTYVQVNGPDGDRIDIGRNEMQAARSELTNSYLRTYQMALRQQPDRSIQSAITSNISNKELADYAVSEAALRNLAAQGDIIVSEKQAVELLQRENVTQEQLNMMLRQQKQSEAQFLYELRANLSNQRAEELITSIARASLLELWLEYRLQNENLTLEYARVPRDPFEEEVEVTDQEIQDYYEENKEEFIRQPQRKYRYVSIAPPPRSQSIAVTEEDARARYEEIDPETDQRYQEPEGKKVRQIILEVDEGETAEEVQERLEEIRQEVDIENFGFVADENTEDLENLLFTGEGEPRKREGLVSGRYTSSVSDQYEAKYGERWVEVVEQLNEGEISDVFESNERYYILLVEDESDGILDFDEARPIIEAELRSERQKAENEKRSQIVTERQEETREIAETRTSIEGIAQALGEDIAETSTTMRQGSISTYLPGVGDLSQDREVLEELEEGDLSPVLRLRNDTLIILELSEVLPERQQELAEVRTDVERAVRMQKAGDLALEAAEAVAERVQSGDQLTSVALEFDLSTKTAENVTPQNPPSDLQFSREYGSFAFGAQTGEVEVLQGNLGDYFVVKVTNKQEPDRIEFFRNLENLEMAITQSKRQAILEEFRKDSVDMIEPEYNEDFISEEPRRRRRRG